MLPHEVGTLSLVLSTGRLHRVNGLIEGKVSNYLREASSAKASRCLVLEDLRGAGVHEDLCRSFSHSTRFLGAVECVCGRRGCFFFAYKVGGPCFLFSLVFGDCYSALVDSYVLFSPYSLREDHVFSSDVYVFFGGGSFYYELPYGNVVFLSTLRASRFGVYFLVRAVRGFSRGEVYIYAVLIGLDSKVATRRSTSLGYRLLSLYVRSYR